MRIAIGVFTLLFGGLHIAAAAAQSKSKDDAVRGSAVIMICGGIAVVCAAAAHLAGGHILHADTLSAAAGGMLICFAAYLNGKQSGNFHLSHHIVRGIIAVLLAVGIFVW